MKSSSSNKNTIQFKSKKEEFENLHKKFNHTKDNLRFYKAHDNSHKILQYPNRRNKGVKKIHQLKEHFKVNKYLKLIILFIIFVSLVFVADKIIFNNTSDSSKIFTSENTQISSSKSSTYSAIIQQTVKKYADIDYTVTTESMHKNGNSIYANGYFEHPSNGKIYFDIKLQNNSPSSLVINGEEYID